MSTLEALDNAIALMAKTGTGAKPADHFLEPQWGMSNAHGMILIGLRNMYVKAPSIQPKDYDDFVGYCLIWYNMIEEHHGLEEAWYFEGFKGAIALDTIVEEHDGFRVQLHNIETYLVSCLPPGTKWGAHNAVAPSDSPNNTFDGLRLVKLIDELVEVFVPHFCDEVTYLEPAKLRASGKVTYEDLRALEQRFKAEVPKIPKCLHVYAVLHRPQKHFPPAPWFVVNIVLPYILSRPQRRNWRFAPAQAK